MPTRQVHEKRHVLAVHQEASRYIVGYSVQRGEREALRRERALNELFAGHKWQPKATLVRAAIDDRGYMIGAAIVEPCMSPELNADPDLARLFATAHRVLAGLYVVPEHRGHGVGAELLQAAAYEAVSDGARYLDGFVDDRNGSADFYRRAAAIVMGHNSGLPGRAPANVTQAHDPGYNGHWFYIDLWAAFADSLMRCPKCSGGVTFEPSDGGRVSCTTCHFSTV